MVLRGMDFQLEGKTKAEVLVLFKKSVRIWGEEKVGETKGRVKVSISLQSNADFRQMKTPSHCQQLMARNKAEECQEGCKPSQGQHSS